MVGGREGGLLDFGEIIVRVAIQFQDADVDHRAIGVRPDFGEVERVPAGALGPFLRLGIGHDLYLHCPAGEIAPLDRAEQVFLRRLAGTADHLGRLGIGPMLVALLGFEVKFDPDAFTGGVDETVGMRAVAIDVAYAGGQAAIGTSISSLMQTFRRQRPEVPHGGGRTQVRPRVALLGVDEVGELVRIAHEEHRRIVADQVPVTLLRIELQGEAAHIAFGIGGASSPATVEKRRMRGVLAFGCSAFALV